MSEVVEQPDASAHPKPDFSDQPKPYKPYKVLTMAEACAMQEPPWLVDGVIPGSGVSVIFGQPNAGKTFVALDMALHVAHGVEWFGRRTEQRPVVYVGLEGAGGIGKRLTGLVLARLPDLVAKKPEIGDIDLVDTPLHLILGEEFRFAVEDDSGVQRLAETVRSLNLEKPMIIIDTLAMAIVGDENGNETMAAVARQSVQLGTLTGGMVVLIHHPSKGNAEALRGGSALNGAIDTSVLVSGVEGKEKTWRMAKTRDGSTEPQYAFNLEPVEIPSLVEGKKGPTTCVVKECPDRNAKAVTRKEPTGANQKKLLGILRATFPNGCTEPQLIEAWRGTLPSEETRRAKSQVGAALAKLVPAYVKRCADGQLMAT